MVQYVERNLLLLVTSVSDLLLRTIKFCSVLFSSSWSSMLQAVIKQEAQLSQRDRAKLRVIEYFADSRSLKVIRNDTVE